jgi:hypothetical protein
MDRQIGIHGLLQEKQIAEIDGDLSQLGQLKVYCENFTKKIYYVVRTAKIFLFKLYEDKRRHFRKLHIF